MSDPITQSYWLLFDYIKPYIIPVPQVEVKPFINDVYLQGLQRALFGNNNYQISFTFQGKIEYKSDHFFGFYQTMVEFLRGSRSPHSVAMKVLHAGTVNEHKIFIAVLKNMILAGKITKDECIKILSKAEYHEALVELLQFDAKENHAERFDL